MPRDERSAFVESRTTDDASLREEVLSLLANVDTRDDLLDRPAIDSLVNRAPAADLAAGQRIGAYRIVSLLGRGGMGEVYRAARADGQFEHDIALKLLRQDSVEHLGLFVSERRILARLEHPGIARLYDAGVADDGRPYMIMELVDGVPITEWCRAHACSLHERLDLFMQVCDAVAYAHQNLVIHRDLKPGNILVTPDGRVKLLDFGIAKLLSSAAAEEATRNTPVTLSYAAPEQLQGGPVSTATDTYALGVLAFELLTARLPWSGNAMPMAVVVNKILDEPAPAPSAVAAKQDRPPVPARQLAGDLDAIVGRTLRKSAADRYAAVSGLRADIKRHLRGEPVSAREGARLYVFSRVLRRYRWAVAGTVVLIASLAAGLAGTLWQARRAEKEAERATATKDFLIGVFRANDPRIASDQPRGAITAKQLLDLSVSRMNQEFVGQPELQIELLGLAASIYGNFPDEERYAAVQKRRIELARAYYGPTHEIVIQGLVSEADAACVRLDYDKANRLLKQTDALMNASGQNHSVMRGDWWRVKARTLSAVPGGQAQRTIALDNALALYADVAPHSNEYAATLNMASRDRNEQGRDQEGLALLKKALAVAETATDRNDALITTLVTNLAHKLEVVGDFSGAETAYARAQTMARRTHGDHHSSYWMVLANHANMIHQRGDRVRADALFERMLASIPPAWTTDTYDTVARETYGERLAAEGRAAAALPLLEAAQKVYLVRPVYEYDLREIRRKLGDAYDRAGRIDEARAALKWSRDEYVEKEGASSKWTLRVRVRWGRFLLDHAATPAIRRPPIPRSRSRGCRVSRCGVATSRPPIATAVFRCPRSTACRACTTCASSRRCGCGAVRCCPNAATMPAQRRWRPGPWPTAVATTTPPRPRSPPPESPSRAASASSGRSGSRRRRTGAHQTRHHRSLSMSGSRPSRCS
jgi:eukaryotic-like serine/threonine-protein kinase